MDEIGIIVFIEAHEMTYGVARDGIDRLYCVAECINAERLQV